VSARVAWRAAAWAVAAVAPRAALAGLATLAACGPGTAGTPPPAQPQGPVAAVVPAGDTSASATLPPGYGRLRQEDIAVRVELVGGVVVQALPLDESVIRLLAPDTYRALRGLLEGQRARLAEIARRYGRPRYSVWDVTYFGTEQGEARFSPQELIVTNVGRDFRPLDVVPLTPGFGEQRLRLRDRQRALFVFDGGIDVSQPIVVGVEAARDSSWNAARVEQLERERALVRSRAARVRP
jgi:hypothetical protein